MPLVKKMSETARPSWRTRYRLILILGTLTIVAVHLAAQEGRTLSFYLPANLKAESRYREQMFLYSKWFNRHFDLQQRFPVSAEEFAAAAQQQHGNADDVRIDPWGTPYAVNYAPLWFTVQSAGPDGAFDTDDDRVMHPGRNEARPTASLAAQP